MFAHKGAADPAEVAVLFSKGNYQELRRMCAFLGSVHETLWELFVNGRKPMLRQAKYSVSRLRLHPKFAGPSIRSIQHDVTQDTTAFLKFVAASQSRVANNL
jgi:predicted translin family RNA/ssDNA-binding protein